MGKYYKDMWDWGSLALKDRISPDLFNSGYQENGAPGVQQVIYNTIGDFDGTNNALLGGLDFSYVSATLWDYTSGIAFLSGQIVYIDAGSNVDLVIETGYIYLTHDGNITGSESQNVAGCLIGEINGDTFSDWRNGRRDKDGLYTQYNTEHQYFHGQVEIDKIVTLNDDLDVVGDVGILGSLDIDTNLNVDGSGVIDGDLYVSGVYLNDLYIDTVSIKSTTSSPGASKIGTYDEFELSSSSNVQDVLDDLDAEIYNLKTTIGLGSLTSAEVDQLENIGSSAISATEWGYVATMQDVSTAASPTFAGLTISPRVNRIKSISSSQFVTKNTTELAKIIYTGQYLTGSASLMNVELYCNIDFPNGSVIKSGYCDNVNNGTWNLYRYLSGNEYNIDGIGAVPSGVWVAFNDTVDNNYVYGVKILSTSSNYKLYGMRFIYTVGNPYE